MAKDQWLIRTKYLVVPLVLLSVGLLVFYSALNWLLIIRMHIVDLDDEIVELWLPAAISTVLVVVLLRSRIRCLKFSTNEDNRRTLYYFAAIAAVAAPTLVGQSYLPSATGSLTRVSHANEIPNTVETKYYEVSEAVCLSKEDFTYESTMATTGKRNQTLTVSLFFVVPICLPERGKGRRSLYLGIRKQLSMSSSVSNEELDLRYRLFFERSVSELEALDTTSFKFLEIVSHRKDREAFDAAIRKVLGVELAARPIVLLAHKEDFSERSGNKAAWVAGSLAIGTAIWFAMVLVPKFEVASTLSRKRQKPKKAIGMRDAFSILVPRKDLYALPLLIDLNIAVFALMVVAGLGFSSFSTDDLLTWGANHRPSLHGIGYARLISSQFVHSGFIHLANNLYGLLFSGIFLGPILGELRLIGAYLICGLGGSIASAIVHPAAVSVGASGAIFGLFGILLSLLLAKDERLAPLRSAILGNVGLFVGLNLLFGSISKTTDNAAHVGGLVTGAALGLIVFARYRATAPDPISERNDGEPPL